MNYSHKGSAGAHIPGKTPEFNGLVHLGPRSRVDQGGPPDIMKADRAGSRTGRGAQKSNGRHERLHEVTMSNITSLEGFAHGPHGTPHPLKGVGPWTRQPRPVKSRSKAVVFVETLGVVRPEPRPRAGRHGVYVPPTAAEWKREVRATVAAEIEADRDLFGVVPLARVPFGVGVVFRFKRPKKHWTGGRPGGTLRSDAPDRHTQAPDFDNCLKAVLDALGPFEGMPRLIWHDDAQVSDPLAGSGKRFCAPGEEPGATIWVFELDPQVAR